MKELEEEENSLNQIDKGYLISQLASWEYAGGGYVNELSKSKTQNNPGKKKKQKKKTTLELSSSEAYNADEKIKNTKGDDMDIDTLQTDTQNEVA